jgi:hypothetical protein
MSPDYHSCLVIDIFQPALTIKLSKLPKEGQKYAKKKPLLHYSCNRNIVINTAKSVINHT